MLAVDDGSASGGAPRAFRLREFYQPTRAAFYCIMGASNWPGSIFDRRDGER